MEMVEIFKIKGCTSREGPLKETVAKKTICWVFKLASDQPLVLINQKDLARARRKFVLSKLDQDAFLPVENDLSIQYFSHEMTSTAAIF